MWAMRPQNYDNNKIIEWYIHHDIIDPDIWTSTNYNWWGGEGGISPYNVTNRQEVKIVQ